MNSSKTAPKVEPARHWINGEWIASSTVANSVSPSTGETLGQYSAGGRAEAAAAIVAARNAFDNGTWAYDPQLRSRALFELADRLNERAEAIALTISREMGKPLGDAKLEATWSPATLRYNAGTALSQTGTSAEVAPGVFATAMREPIGVAGIIVPWNSPLALLLRALGPALAAGCTTAIKLPGQTALVNSLIAEAAAAAGSLPKGVVNIFTEAGNEGAPLLVESPDVDVINYTGSTKVGRQVAEKGAQTLKRICLELGGKTPLIVFEDADIEAFAPLVVTALTKFNGEFCMTGSRVLVQRSVADAWRERIASLLEKVVVGRADDPETQMGPLIDKANVARIDRIVEDAKRYARIIVRGGPIVDGPLAAGAFYRPAMLETEALNVPLVQDEIFGPVLSFETFATEEEAITRANATVFGLAAALFTKDFDRAHRVARAIKAGTVWTNTWATLSDAFEEGGFKYSGIGRARGLRAMEEFQEVKTQFRAVRALGGASPHAGALAP
ncbi:MAG TPA: aldehyde dehydrogenase family protein [Candidatus Sulfotelmatobacter sp.]|nr:aldehyde dehydrogenase family protein [Candidatus Sulfotelmatobacter sp.]